MQMPVTAVSRALSYGAPAKVTNVINFEASRCSEVKTRRRHLGSVGIDIAREIRGVGLGRDR